MLIDGLGRLGVIGLGLGGGRLCRWGEMVIVFVVRQFQFTLILANFLTRCRSIRVLVLHFRPLLLYRLELERPGSLQTAPFFMAFDT